MAGARHRWCEFEAGGWSRFRGRASLPAVAKTGTYNTAVTVYELSASLPVTLSFLEAMNSFLNSNDVTTAYTLVVADEVRWIGE